MYVMYAFVLFAWFLTTVISLILMRKRDLSQAAKAIWDLVIILVPFFGPAAFALATYDRRKP